MLSVAKLGSRHNEFRLSAHGSRNGRIDAGDPVTADGKTAMVANTKQTENHITTFAISRIRKSLERKARNGVLLAQSGILLISQPTRPRSPHRYLVPSRHNRGNSSSQHFPYLGFG